MRVFLAFLLMLLSYKLVFASSDEAEDYQEYYSAYNICSPAAHSITRQECNYSNVFQKHYVNCMYGKGYGDDSDATSKDYYKGYFATHNQCSIVADRAAQKYCGYRTLYYKHYNSCMRKYGFDENGEKIPDSERNPQDKSFQFNF